MVADPEEIAFHEGWISGARLEAAARRLRNSASGFHSTTMSRPFRSVDVLPGERFGAGG